MLDINFIRQNPDAVREGVSMKKIDPRLIDDFLAFDKSWRELINEIDNLRAEQKKLSQDRKIEKAKELKEEIKKSEERLKKIEAERMAVLYLLPNLPLFDVPAGQSEDDNVEIKKWGKIPEFDFEPKDHLTLGEALNIIDVQRAAKVSGARFNYLKGQAAFLELALVQYAFETIANNGFIPIMPPAMIKPEMMRAMGYMDRGGDEIYHLKNDDLVLIGTSEQAIGPMHAGEIFEENDLPRRYVAFSPCFRREAGSYGKDTRGILRVHQFDKLEMFSITTPEKSVEEHKFLLSLEEKLMQGLKLPYRVLNICTADLGDSAAAKYDIEVWMPSQNRYRETHSASNTTEFQSRRLNIKYRFNRGVNYVHMLNGTAFAIGRIIIAILENYQQKDGSILIPEALQKYLGFTVIPA